MQDNRKDKDFISASIHKDFYYNNDLGSPTIIKEYTNLNNILDEVKYVACIAVQIKQLSKIEYLYGSTSYNDLLTKITDILKAYKKTALREDDIFG